MRLALALTLSLLLAGCGRAATGGLAMTQVTPKSPARIVLTSSAWAPGGVIDARHTAFGAGLSPPLSWTPAAGAAAYALVVEDPDAPLGPFTHWMIWNIPADVTSLPEGVLAARLPTTPQGAVQGKNGADSWGYYGPHPPSGTHHYHFEIFALDQPLTVPDGADVHALAATMKGHVLADGDLVGTVTAP